MSDKRYPTRMHEVLGVEPEERFMYSDYGDREFWLSKSGLMYRICDDGTSIPTTQGTLVLFINHLERIVRKPRLSEEQVRRLKALYDYGMRWMFFSHLTARDPWLYATTNKPSCTEPDWDGQGGWSWDGERLRIKGSPLNELERVCADSPLDIVATLKAAGVEVEE